MSEVVKPKKKNPVIKTLQWIGVAAVSLLLVGYFIFSDSFKGRNNSILVGKVNGQPIYYTRDSEFARNYEQIMNSMQAFNNIGGAFEGFAEYQAFLQTVNNILLYNQARKHILVSDEYIVNNIKGLFFTDSAGAFNQAAYEAFLKNQSVNEKMRLEKNVKKNIEVEVLRYELFQTPKLSSFDIYASYLKENTKRSVQMVYKSASSIVAGRTPSDSELDAFFKANATNFVQANISWIVVKSGTTANNLYNALKDNKSMFAAKAKEASEDAATKALGGEVGYMTIDEMPSKSISDLVFKVKKDGTLLEPIFFDNKYYLILVNSIRIPDTMDKVSKETLIAKYNAKESPKLIEAEKAVIKSKILTDYKNAVPAVKYENETDMLKAMDTTLKNEGYEVYISGDFAYGASATDAVTGTTLPGSYEEAFSKAVFATPIGSESGIIELPNGIAIVKVLGETKKSPEDFNKLTNEEKDAFIYSVRNTHAQRLASEWAKIAYGNARVKYDLKRNK